MPFEIENHEKYLLLRLLPAVTADDLRRAVVALGQAETTLQGSKNRITDLSRLDTIDVGFPEVEMVAKMRRELKLTAPIRSAIVAPRPIQFGFARMFQTLNDNPNIDLRIVTTMDEALLWVASD